MAEQPDSSGQAHPEVQRRVEYPVWQDGKPFPLTPLEAWYVLQGWAVRPAAGMSMDTYMDMPGKVEIGDGWFRLWQS